jgi:hypothetical protein
MEENFNELINYATKHNEILKIITIEDQSKLIMIVSDVCGDSVKHHVDFLFDLRFDIEDFMVLDEEEASCFNEYSNIIYEREI